MTEYNARIEWATRTGDDDLVDALVDYHPAVSRSERGWVEATVTLPAETLRQAATTALAIAEAASAAVLDGAAVLVLEVLPTPEFDERNGLVPMPELVSTTEAAEKLGVSRQAVLQRLESGSLPGTKVGKTWVVQARALTRHNLTADDAARIVAAKAAARKDVPPRSA
jgi:excisionase family DNA binding protein